MAVVQLHHDTEGRGYYRRKLAAGKTTMAAMRCLKQRLSDIAYRHIACDAQRLATGPEGHTGAATNSNTADLIPTASTSDQPIPIPANHHPRHPFLYLLYTEGSHEPTPLFTPHPSPKLGHPTEGPL